MTCFQQKDKTEAKAVIFMKCIYTDVALLKNRNDLKYYIIRELSTDYILVAYDKTYEFSVL